MKSVAKGTLVRLAISMGALILLTFSLRDKLGHALEILRSGVDWGSFAIACGVYTLGLVLLAFRLQLVFRVQKIHLSVGETFYLNFVGLFFNIFFPSAVGGDLAKAYYAYKHSGKKIASTTSVILDRLMGFVALISMSLVAVAIFSRQLNDPRIDHLVYIFLAVMVAAIIFFASKRVARLFKFIQRIIPSEKWRARISEIYHAIHGYRHHKLEMFMLIFLSFVGQSFFILSHYWVAKSLDIRLGPGLYFILIPVISIISMAPSVGGLGVREAGIVYLFKRFISSEHALALSLLIDILIYGFSLAGGVLFAIRGGLKAKEMTAMEEIES